MNRNPETVSLFGKVYVWKRNERGSLSLVLRENHVREQLEAGIDKLTAFIDAKKKKAEDDGADA